MYVYQADVYCDDCGRDIADKIKCERSDAISRSPNGLGSIRAWMNQAYDSDHMPQGPYSDSNCESDSLQFCASCSGHIDCRLTPDGIEDTITRVSQDDVNPEYLIVARDVLKAHGIDI